MCSVSIIIPAFNAAKTIKKTIDSIINQSFTDWEVIVIDDGSSDNLKEVISEFNENRIQYYFQDNSGPGAARNNGIEKASGNYLMFVDADDIIHRDYISRLVFLLENNNADISMCGYKKIKEDLITDDLIQSKMEDNDKFEIFSSEQSINLMFYKDKVMPYPFLKLFKKSVIGDIRFPENIKLGEDLEFNLNVFKKSKAIVYTGEELYFHIINPQSITNSLNYYVAEQHFYRLKDLLLSEDVMFSDAICCRLFVASMDLLSKNLLEEPVEKTFINDCVLYVKENRKKVLKNRNTTAVVRVMAFLSIISVRATVKICKAFRNIKIKKAI